MSKTKLFIGDLDMWAVTDGKVRVRHFFDPTGRWRDAYRSESSLLRDMTPTIVNNFKEIEFKPSL